MKEKLCNFLCLFLSKKKAESFRKKYLFNIDKNFMKNNLYSTMLNFYQEQNIANYANKPMDNIFKYKDINYVSLYCYSYIEYLFKGQNIIHSHLSLNNNFPCLHWGYKKTGMSLDTLNSMTNYNNRLFFLEDGFLRSITMKNDKNAREEYKTGISFIIDDLTCYYDFTKTSRIEQMLNDKKLVITNEQKARARKLIDTMVKNKINRYNYMPTYKPEIGQHGRSKVLIFDQSYDDEYSIFQTNANEHTLKKMLDDAIAENPNSDIIIKIHPDNISKNKDSYYTKLKEKKGLYKVYTNINPLSLIDICDKVYVCNTSLGLNALFMNKEVHVYGLPFYANWGLTIDDKICPRRNNTRTLEELVYIFYIMYTYYVDPRTQARCEVEDALDYLIELRTQYYIENNIRFEE